MADWQVITGDCMDVLRDMPAASVDAVVCDPTFGINTKSDGSGKLSPWADLCNSSMWYAAWIGACRRILKPTGFLWSCLNWRSLTTFQKASCDLGWPIESLAIWDKEWIGPGGNRGLRPAYECVALWCCESAAIADRGIPDMIRAKWCGHKPTGHPAEKPVELMAWCIGMVHGNPPKILDPFCGSGTTGVAAVRAGCDFVGIEMDPEWAECARRRIAAECGGLFREPARATETQGVLIG